MIYDQDHRKDYDVRYEDEPKEDSYIIRANNKEGAAFLFVREHDRSDLLKLSGSVRVLVGLHKYDDPEGLGPDKLYCYKIKSEMVLQLSAQKIYGPV